MCAILSRARMQSAQIKRADTLFDTSPVYYLAMELAAKDRAKAFKPV